MTSQLEKIKSALTAAGFSEAMRTGLSVTRAGFSAVVLQGGVMIIAYHVVLGERGADKTKMLHAYYSALIQSQVCRQASMKIHSQGCDLSPGRNSGHIHIWF